MPRHKRMGHIQSDNDNFFSFISFFGLLVLLFYPPYFRGLFFQTEQQWTLIFAALLFAITWLGKLSNREISFLKKPLDYLALALVVSYMISFFFAANPRLAMAEVIKYTIYFLVFWLCSQQVRNNKDVNWFLHAIYFAGIGVALAGVMTASGMINIKDGFIYGRISSTMQYPNALAAYLAALSFIGIYLWIKAVSGEKKIDRIPGYLYAAGNYFLLLIYIGTGSRGGLIVYPLVLLIYFIGLGKEYRNLAFGHFVLTLIGAMAANIKLMPMLAAGNPAGAWLWFFIGAAAALAGQALLYALSKIKISRQILGFAAGAVLIFIVAFGWIQVKETEAVSKIMPGHLISSIQNIKLSDRNVQERFVFWQDAFKIVKEHPVVGLGGGAFEETNRRYQSYYYASTQAHNHYVQMWSEAGTLGLLIFISLWAFYKLMVYNLIKQQKNSETRIMIWSMFGTAAMIGIHAFLDFDLSLSSISIVLFAMLGLTRGVERYTYNENKYLAYEKISSRKWFFYGGIILVSTVIIVYMTMLNMGLSHAADGSKAYHAQDLDRARDEFEKAVSLDRLNEGYKRDLSKVYLSLNEKEKAVQTAEEAVKIAPYNLDVLGNAVSIYSQIGDVDKVLTYSERLVENFPYSVGMWEGLNYRYFVAGYMSWTEGNITRAEEILKKAAGIPGRIENKMAGVSEEHLSMWGVHLLPVMSVTPSIQLYTGASQYIMGDWENGEINLKTAFDNLEDQKLKGEAAMWLSVLYIKQEKSEQAEVIAEQGEDLIDNFENSVRGLANIEVIK